VIVPNLASRPFLNTRPVWLVTACAGVAALILIAVNIGFYVRSNRVLRPQIEYRNGLLAEERALAADLSGQVSELEQVPWRSLASRVEATNVILRERAFSWLRLLDDVERVMPYDVRILRVSPSIGPDDVELGLVVVARTREAMLEFLENLLADPSFSQPTPRREETPEQSEAPGYTLALSVRYLPPGDAP
jgi:Tfp pilus assembly protein PilN